jgi:hypothetical protein
VALEAFCVEKGGKKKQLVKATKTQNCQTQLKNENKPTTGRAAAPRRRQARGRRLIGQVFGGQRAR